MVGTTNNPFCTECNNKLIPIVYGYLLEPLDNDYKSGGCLPPVDGKKRWWCNSCNKSIITDRKRTKNI